jgi:hypothetical protein
MALPAPAHLRQLDGSAMGRWNCAPTAGAMALDAYTGGRVRVTPAAMRAATGKASGGMSLWDLQRGWKRGWGLSMSAGYVAWPAVRARLAAGLGVMLPVNYGAMKPWRAKGSTFTGIHMLYLQSLSAAGVLLDDPLSSGPATVPESVIKAAWIGGAGWGSGAYSPAAGAGASSGAGGTRTVAQELGVPDATPFDAGLMARCLSRLQAGTATERNYKLIAAGQAYALYVGRSTAGQVPWLDPAPAAPDPLGVNAAVASLSSGLTDALGRGVLLAAILAVAGLGLALTFAGVSEKAAPYVAAGARLAAL